MPDIDKVAFGRTDHHSSRIIFGAAAFFMMRQDKADRILELLLEHGINHIDLIQLHNLVKPAEWDTAFEKGGALEAVIKAREKGQVRFIGVTGHGVEAPHMHLRSLERFEFDSVLLPLSYMMMRDKRYADGFHRLLDICVQRRVAVQTIKSIARRRWLPDNTDRR